MSINQLWNGKVVAITGGGSGIGAAVAAILADQGAAVTVIDCDGEQAHKTVESLPCTDARHLAVTADVRDSESLSAAMGEIADRLGGIDVVLANAGIGEAGTVATSAIADLVRTLDINLTGTVRTVHAALPYVTERKGYVLVMSSAAALKNVPGGSCYAASKSGVEAFAGALRLEVAHKGVAVGVVHPAWVRTPMYDAQARVASIREGIAQLPWPFNVVTDVDRCARLIVAGMQRRQRKIYVPPALRVVDTFRGVFTGALWDRILRPRVALTVPAMEAELGRNKVTGR
ncbi:SDR family NAD(P)-dependent oxidoreductase [Nocardia sp. NPDC003979]